MLEPKQVAANLDDVHAWASWLVGWRFAADSGQLAAVHRAVMARPAHADTVSETLSAPVDRAGEVATVLRLAAVGRELEETERGAWARAEVKVHAKRDALVRGMWTRWAAGDPWGDQARWTQLLRKPVRGAFRQALSTRSLPSHVVGRALGDLDDALFYQLLGGGERAAGLAEIAVWALESAPGGPAAPLLGVLEDRERAVVARCVTRRGHWPDTIAAALPSLPGSAERALHLQSGPLEAAEVEVWLDLHVALRLVRRWHEPGAPSERQDRAILVQNRGRSRGRLRAVATRRPAVALTEALWSMDGLADRTVAAARRWAWAWAWEALATDFAFDLGQAVLRPCATEAGSEPLHGDDLDALRVWALLVLLRGRFDTLQRWARTAEGDRDGTWGRLLGEVPDGLRDADGGLARVRAAWVQHGAVVCKALAPLVADIASLSAGRTLKRSLWERVGPHWNDAVRVPGAGFPTFLRSAEAWVSAHGSEWAVPVPLPGHEEGT